MKDILIIGSKWIGKEIAKVIARWIVTASAVAIGVILGYWYIKSQVVSWITYIPFF